MMGTCFEHREGVIDSLAQSACFDQLEAFDMISIVEEVAAENVHGAPLDRRRPARRNFGRGEKSGKPQDRVEPWVSR